MYKVFYEGELIHDPHDVSRRLTSLAIEQEQNACGYCDFDMPVTHPAHGQVRERGVVTVKDGDSIIYEGYVHELGEDFERTGTIKTRGVLAYLGDTIVRPYTTLSPAPSGYAGAPASVDGYFQWLIDQHNARVTAAERFVVGINDGSRLDPNNYLYRESKQYPTTAEEIEEKILDSLGGYVRVRWPDGVRTIDLMADPYDANETQILDFGSNLLDFTHTEDALDMITAVVPKGSTPQGEGDRVLPVSVAGLPDGSCGDDYEKRGDMVVRLSAERRYGLITDTYEDSQCSDPATLLRHAVAYLGGVSEPRVGIEVKAVDLSLIDPTLEPIRCGRYIRVRSKPHGFDSYMLCSKARLDLLDPSQDEYELGMTYEAASGIQNRRIGELNASINNVYEAVAPLPSAVASAALNAQNAIETAQSVEATAGEAKEVAQNAQQVAQSANAGVEEAKTTAQAAQSTAEAAQGAADNAQQVAQSATATAENAQQVAQSATTSANDAKEAAATAASKADAAQGAAAAAQATAAQTSAYFFADTEGAHVASVEGDATTGGNALITPHKMVFRDGTDEMMKIDSEQNAITLGRGVQRRSEDGRELRRGCINFGDSQNQLEFVRDPWEEGDWFKTFLSAFASKDAKSPCVDLYLTARGEEDVGAQIDLGYYSAAANADANGNAESSSSARIQADDVTVWGNLTAKQIDPTNPSGKTLLEVPNASGNCMFGYGNYVAGSGDTNLYGNNVNVTAAKSIGVTPKNGSFKVFSQNGSSQLSVGNANYVDYFGWAGYSAKKGVTRIQGYSVELGNSGGGVKVNGNLLKDRALVKWTSFDKPITEGSANFFVRNSVATLACNFRVKNDMAAWGASQMLTSAQVAELWKYAPVDNTMKMTGFDGAKNIWTLSFNADGNVYLWISSGSIAAGTWVTTAFMWVVG